MASNIERKFFVLNVRRDGPQPSIFVRSFSAITNKASIGGVQESNAGRHVACPATRSASPSKGVGPVMQCTPHGMRDELCSRNSMRIGKITALGHETLLVHHPAVNQR